MAGLHSGALIAGLVEPAAGAGPQTATGCTAEKAAMFIDVVRETLAFSGHLAQILALRKTRHLAGRIAAQKTIGRN